jgi:hypothetical protein
MHHFIDAIGCAAGIFGQLRAATLSLSADVSAYNNFYAFSFSSALFCNHMRLHMLHQYTATRRLCCQDTQSRQSNRLR